MKKTICTLFATLLLAGCTGLHAPAAQDVSLYMLDAHASTGVAAQKRDLIVAVAMPRARPGYDTAQIAYVQQPHQLEYYAVNRWADTPAHMLAPLLVQTLEQYGGYRAVVQAPGPVPADLRLDTELVRLQQDFEVKPSRIEITLRVQLTDLRNNRVLATRVFDETETASSDNAYGGVIAANRALQRILEQLPAFCMGATAAP